MFFRPIIKCTGTLIIHSVAVTLGNYLLYQKVHEHISVPLPVLDQVVQMQLPQRQLDVAAPLITSAARRSDGYQALPRATGSPPAGPPEALNPDKQHRNELPRITQINYPELCTCVTCTFLSGSVM